MTPPRPLIGTCLVDTECYAINIQAFVLCPSKCINGTGMRFIRRKSVDLLVSESGICYMMIYKCNKTYTNGIVMKKACTNEPDNAVYIVFINIHSFFIDY